MKSDEPAKTLELPAPQKVLLAEIERLMKEVQLLHPLLDLLQKPEGLGRQLSETLKELATEMGDIGVQLAQVRKQNSRIEAKLDQIMTGEIKEEEF